MMRAVAAMRSSVPRTQIAAKATSSVGRVATFHASAAARAGDIIGVDLGTTNSCVAIMEVGSLATSGSAVEGDRLL